jgi:hypothetical protein
MQKRYGGKFHWPNLKTPKSFNEKILWLKLNYRTELGTQVADKFAVREWVSKKIGMDYLIPLIDVYPSPLNIDFDKLPEKFVLKPNHGSGMVILCNDKNKLDTNDSIKKLLSWEKMNYYYYGREWQYKGIKPLVVCEQMLESNEPLADYKFFCFNGEPKYVQVDFDRFTRHTRCFYNMEWIKQPFALLYPYAEKNLEKPSTFEEMKKIAKVLSQDFLFTRVDLYNLGDKIFFGEITLHPEGGNGPFQPAEHDQFLGKELELSS